ncbi:hypothetical protein [Amycolatopsis circi]|uniref:hypothetical protein n=1 Tax=Amycolatopsis circi TaxID=871959 RepID=UPI0013BE967D|nr:hypothetical protein [Amycolatopsis circi]
MPVQGRPLLHLVSPLGAGPMFLDPPSRTVDEGLNRVLSTPRAEVRAELRRRCAIDRPLTSWTKGLAEQDRDVAGAGPRPATGPSSPIGGTACA